MVVVKAKESYLVFYFNLEYLMHVESVIKD